MKYEEFAPHSSLEDSVKCFWMLEREYTPEHPAEDVTPDGFVELIINLGTPYRLQSCGSERVMPRAILVGLQRKPLRFLCAGTVKLVAVRFFAWGILPLLASPADHMELAAAAGREWDDIAARIELHVRRGDYASAVAIVQDHLI